MSQVIKFINLLCFNLGLYNYWYVSCSWMFPVSNTTALLSITGICGLQLQPQDGLTTFVTSDTRNSGSLCSYRKPSLSQITLTHTTGSCNLVFKIKPLKPPHVDIWHDQSVAHLVFIQEEHLSLFGTNWIPEIEKAQTLLEKWTLGQVSLRHTLT